MRRSRSAFTASEREASTFNYSRTLSRGGMKQYHQHDEYELSVLMHGEGRCYMGSDILFMQPRQLYIIPPGMLHLMTYHDETPHVMYHIYFRPSLLEQLKIEFDLDLQKFLARQRMLPLTAELERLLGQIHEAFPDAQDNANTIDRDMRHLLIKCVLLSMSRQMSSVQSEAGTDAIHPQIQDTLRFMGRHFAEELPLCVLSSRCGLSAAYFCRLFRQETGLTPTEYLNSLRIQNACRLLKQSDLNISQAALESGFNSVAYFDRQFQRHMGMTPSAYLSTLSS